RSAVSHERYADAPPADDVPEDDGARAVADGDELPVRRESNCIGGDRTREIAHAGPPGDVPEGRRPRQACRSEQFAVRAEVDVDRASGADQLRCLLSRPKVVESVDSVGAPDRQRVTIRT